MRTIIFRGKRKDNGEWVEGNFYESQISGCYILENKLLATVGGRRSRATIRDKLIPYEVDPETVSQYTGLKDKNGKRIFEGDIVICGKEINGNIIDRLVEIGFVEMRHGAFGLHRKQGYYRPFKDWLEDYEYEVIGNIHDNPELLEIK